MANMSYCRFQNTLNDLRDCDRNMGEVLGEEEHEARENTIALCREIVDFADAGNVPEKPEGYDEDEEVE